MKFSNKIYSNTIHFKLAEISDSSFIYTLRINNSLNKHLSKVYGDVYEQEKWLQNYKIREAQNQEYYFIIYRNDSIPIGTVRLYDFLQPENSFSWGSWVLNEHKTRFAALESMLLVYCIGFETLNFTQSHFEVMKENTPVISFHLKYGAHIICEDDTYLYFTFKASDFITTKEKFNKYLKR